LALWQRWSQARRARHSSSLLGRQSEGKLTKKAEKFELTKGAQYAEGRRDATISLAEQKTETLAKAQKGGIGVSIRQHGIVFIHRQGEEKKVPQE